MPEVSGGPPKPNRPGSAGTSETHSKPSDGSVKEQGTEPRATADTRELTGNRPPSEAERLEGAVERARAVAGRSDLPRAGWIETAPARSPSTGFSLYRSTGAAIRGLLTGNSPLAAIGRSALRMVPGLGLVVAGADAASMGKSLSRGESAPRKLLAGARAVSGVVAGLTGLALAAGVGGVALPVLGVAVGVGLVADVGLSRLRTGHW